jgi:hypothetical protein
MVKGLTIEIGADTKKFNREINKMDRSIKNTNKEVFNLSRSLELEWDANKFVQAQKAAQQSLEQTEVKAKALRDRLKYLEEVDGGKQSQEYEQVRSKLAEAEFHASRFRQELQQLKNLKIEEMAKKFETVGESITKAGQAMLPLSAAAASILAGFSKIGVSAIKTGDYIGTTAQQLNISTKALQEWLYVAQQTDVDQSQLVNSIKKIQQALGNLAAGEIEATSDALRALGFTQEQAMAGMSENFEPIINALANMEDATLQAHYANELFGARMAANIIPLLNDGGEGLKSLTEEFQSFNYLTDEQVQALDAFEDTWDRVKYLFQTIANQVGTTLLPTFQALADVLENRVAPAVQKLADWFSQLSQAQKNSILGSLTFVAALAPMLLVIGKITSGIGGAIKHLGLLSKALGFLAAHPVILVIGVVIGLMALLYKKNEEFRNSVNGLFASLKNLLMPVLNAIGGLFTNLFQSLMPLINILLNIITPVLTVVIKGITILVNLLAKVLIPYIEFLGKVWGKVFGFIPTAVEGVVTAVEWMINKVIGLINKLIDRVNSIGKYVGLTLDRIDDVNIDISAPKWNDVNVNQEVKTTTEATVGSSKEADGFMQTQDVLKNNYATTNIQNNSQNYDYSTKDISINVTVENYAENLDVDDLVTQINMKLAEQM